MILNWDAWTGIIYLDSAIGVRLSDALVQKTLNPENEKSLKPSLHNIICHINLHL